MPDHPRAGAPANWSDAFAALPLSEAPDLWPSIAGRSAAVRHRRAIGGFALAATLIVAIALPWTLRHDAAPAAPVSAATASDPDPVPDPVPDPELESLYAQSAQLEALLSYARDDRVASGSAETVASRLDQRLASIDAALAQAGLSADAQRRLWRARVATLRSLAGFESNRRLLSARGERYDGALVRVD